MKIFSLPVTIVKSSDCELTLKATPNNKKIMKLAEMQLPFVFIAYTQDRDLCEALLSLKLGHIASWSLNLRSIDGKSCTNSIPTFARCQWRKPDSNQEHRPWS